MTTLDLPAYADALDRAEAYANNQQYESSHRISP